jgi:hypothetical protein
MNAREVYNILKKFGIAGVTVVEERRSKIAYTMTLSEVTNVINEAFKVTDTLFDPLRSTREITRLSEFGTIVCEVPEELAGVDRISGTIVSDAQGSREATQEASEWSGC